MQTLTFTTLEPLVIIPGRLNSTRLPNKILADIEGQPMIRRVYERAKVSQVGPIIVACDSHEIAWEIEKIGGHAVMTDPALPTGSDRAYAALQQYDPQGRYNAIICVQGDSPTIDPQAISAAVKALDQDPSFDIVTLATPMTHDKDINNTHIVKIALTPGDANLHKIEVHGSPAHDDHKITYKDDVGSPQLDVRRALYFSRAPIPHGHAPKYHHIGLYAYRRQALERYMQLPPSPLEKSESLEQLRALEASMTIGVVIVDTIPIGVDTQAQLEQARDYYRRLMNNT